MSRASNSDGDEANADRQRWMGVLAKAACDDLEDAYATIGSVPTFTWIRPPESGLVMVQGRAGGTGAAFNLGEVTVTRCALLLASGETGVAYVQGRDKRHAELAAIFDAMLQDPARHTRLQEDVIDTLSARRDRKRTETGRKVAATRVDFFTMVRGEDPQ